MPIGRKLYIERLRSFYFWNKHNEGVINRGDWNFTFKKFIYLISIRLNRHSSALIIYPGLDEFYVSLILCVQPIPEICS